VRRLLCWLGIHKIAYEKSILSVAHCRCVNCNKRFINTLYGLMDLD
jgi:hypothetical protein